MALVFAAIAVGATAFYYFNSAPERKSSKGEPARDSSRMERSGAGGSKVEKSSGENAAGGQSVGSAESSDTPTQGGRAEVKPVEGELIEPVKRDNDFGIYLKLQDKLKFAVLYPGYMPPGSAPEGSESAFQMVEQGVNGFALRYRSEKFGSVTIMEGSVFDPIPGKEREQIKIRGGTAYLEKIEEGRYAVFFAKNGIRYGLAGDGMDKEEIRKIATALVPVSELK